MTMKVKFNIGDIVEIKTIKIQGTVVGIYITSGQIQYQIRYFQNGESKQIYFYEFEISDPTEKLLGFQLLGRVK